MKYLPNLRLTSFLFLLLTSLTVTADVSTVRATVDKNPAMADESITLTVTADDSVDREAFDPSKLLSDFVVGRTNISNQTQMVNFKTTRSTVWTTTLIPRKPGQFRIPSFTIEGVSSQPIDVLVVPASNARPGGRDLFVTTQVDHQRVYLQQQLKYVVRLHLARDLQRGSLSAPTLENADIRQIGKDKEFSEIIDGVRYRIIERVFAVTPQQSGRFVIDGPLFEGEVVEANQQSFGFFNRTKSVSRVGPSIEVEVLPIPSDTNHHWLPSEYVQLNEEWQPANGEYRVGEPITRTLTLTAVGVVEEQLPDIGSQYPTSVKTYPDQAASATVDREDTLVAQRTESFAIIPSEAGQIAIPAVSVPWFNTVTQQTEFATLPARTINVEAALASAQTALPSLPIAEVQNDAAGADLVTATSPSILPYTASWWSLSSWVLLALWLVTIVLWRRAARGTTKAEKVLSRPFSESENAAYKLLQQQLKTSQVEKIRPALTHWMALLCGDPALPLPVSQQRVSDENVNAQINIMFASVYGQDKQHWDSKALIQAIAVLRDRKITHRQSSETLQALYPA